MKLTRLALLSCCVAMAMSASAFATTIAGWTFETSIPTTAGPHAAEVGTGAALGSHASGSAVYSNPAGNGSAESFSSNFWSVGDYYQFSTSTLGYSGLVLTFDATGSNTGPADFKVQASTDGVSFSDIGFSYALTNDGWSASTANPVSTRSTALPASLNNQASIFVRLVQDTATAINGNPVATGGTSRIDNVLITSIPEPTTIGLALASLGGLLIRRK
jgi:hypothetical protein